MQTLIISTPPETNFIDGDNETIASLKKTGSNGENAWFAIDFGSEKPCKILQIQFIIYDSVKGGYLKVNILIYFHIFGLMQN